MPIDYLAQVSDNDRLTTGAGRKQKDTGESWVRTTLYTEPELKEAIREATARLGMGRQSQLVRELVIAGLQKLCPDLLKQEGFDLSEAKTIVPRRETEITLDNIESTMINCLQRFSSETVKRQNANAQLLKKSS